MSHSTLVNAQLKVPLRSLALTVEEPSPGEFCWRILESREDPRVFESISCSDITFAAYDTALATGYGELQRLVGPDLQWGPRSEEDAQGELLSAPSPKSAASGPDKRASVNGFKPGPVPA
ncbi:hypothetical protein ACEN8I_00355 [Polaromonas sp. CT11-55]|uniref:hypothetical protein n=1 Tax=Polaromonas sp. CT11-55 TaxID=3243045 RepID=UPI0039A405EF